MIYLQVTDLFLSEMKYAYSDVDSCVSSSQAPPLNAKMSSKSRLKELSRSNLNVALKNPVTTTDYGFIDMPHNEFKSSRTDILSSKCRNNL